MQKTRVKKWGPFVTTGLAMEAAVLLGVGHTVSTPTLPVHLLSASIFVDGTKPIVGPEDGVPFVRMADSFQGRYVPDGSAPVFVDYPRSLGVATGLSDPTYDESEADAAAKVVRAVRQARADDPAGTIYVVGYSQGAGTVASALAQLERDPDFDTGSIEFVQASSPRRNAGGILTRLPPGVYLPLVGVTFGEGTTPERTRVLQVSKMYDGVSDAPDFVLNVAADSNAVLGFVFLHSGYYQEVDPDDPTAIVTTTADGLVTDKLIPAPVGQLPLTMPLLQLGVPADLVTAMDPFLRAVIETGYQRADPAVPGSFPSEPVPFRLVPPPTRWISDADSVTAGAVRSAELVGDFTASALTRSHGPLVVPAATESAVESADDEAAAPARSRESSAREAETDSAEQAPATSGSAPRRPGGWRPGDLLRSVWAKQPPAGSRAAEAKPDTAPQSAGSDVEAGTRTHTERSSAQTTDG